MASFFVSKGCLTSFLGLILIPCFVYHQPDYNPKAPNDNCTRSCGNIPIPFPFGIEEGCFANDNLRLNCTSNATLVLDRGYAQYRVTKLSLDDGLMMVTNMLNDTSSNNMERVVITNYDGQYQSFYTTYTEVVDDNFDFSQEDVVIKWAIANITCQKAMLNKATYACISDNSFCKEVMRGKTHDGYRCKCSDGFQGNPYLKNSCTGYISLLYKLICTKFLVSLILIYLIVLLHMLNFKRQKYYKLWIGSPTNCLFFLSMVVIHLGRTCHRKWGLAHRTEPTNSAHHPSWV